MFVRRNLWIVCLLWIGLQGCPSAGIDFLKSTITVPKAEQVLKTTFIQQRFLQGIPKPIQSSGDLILWAGKGLIWRTIKPFPSVILMTQKGIYQVINGQKIPLVESSTTKHEAAVFSMFSKILGGDFASLDDFSVDQLSAPPNWKIRLAPNNPTIQRFLPYLILEGINYISHVTLFRSDNDHAEIVFDNHTLFEKTNLDQVLSLQEKTLFD